MVLHKESLILPLSLNIEYINNKRLHMKRKIFLEMTTPLPTFYSRKNLFTSTKDYIYPTK